MFFEEIQHFTAGPPRGRDARIQQPIAIRFRATADVGSRSLMNVTFVTGNAALDEKFIATTQKQGLNGLKGHRSVGGMRASIYNAFPMAGIDALVASMKAFEAENA